MQSANSYQQQISKDGLTNWQVVALAAQACDLLKWPYTIKDNTGLTAITNAWENYGEQVLISFENDMISLRSECRFAAANDGGRNQQNIETLFIPAFTKLKETTSDEELNALTYSLEHKEELETAAFNERVQKGELTAAEKIALGTGGHYITYGIIAVNVIVFILMCVRGVSLWEPTVNDIVEWGGNLKAYTMGGEWWRLLTCVFVHIGIIHIAFNMYALYIIGTYLEPLLGRWKFITSYLCTGIFASITSMLWHGDTVSAGASGAIFGMYGLFLALLTTNYIDKNTRRSMLTSIGVFVGYNLLYGLKAGIDNAAHVGGLLSGFAIGYVFYFTDLKKIASEKRSISLSVIVAVATLLFAFVTLKTGNNDDVKFQKAVVVVQNMEGTLINQMQRLQNLPTTKAENLLQDSTIPGWTNFYNTLDETKNYTLDNKAKSTQTLWMKYSSLRLQQTKLFYKAIHENTDAHANELDSINDEILKIIESLRN